MGEAPTTEKAFAEAADWGRPDVRFTQVLEANLDSTKMATVDYLGGCPVGPL